MTRLDPTDLDALRSHLAATSEALKPLTVQEIRIASDALAELPDVVRRRGAGDRPTALAMDATPMLRAGTSVKPEVVTGLRSVAGDRLKVIELGSVEHPPHAEAEDARALARRVRDAEVVIAFGSGTVTDLAKHAVYLNEFDAGQPGHARTLIVCPTACTVTAYTSTMSILTTDGVKRTAASRGPDVVLVDLTLVADAPPALTAAGFGDMMARCVAPGDWLLAHRLGLDPDFSTVPLDLLAHAEAMLFNHAAGIGRGEPAAVRHLVDALLLAGIAMSVANQTAPISGWEHTMSHYFDLRHAGTGHPLALHGAQVGAGTLVAARAYDALIAEPSVHAAAGLDHFSPFASTEATINELWHDYRGKWSQWAGNQDTLRRFDEAWTTGTLRSELRSFVRPADTIARALADVGAPLDLAVSAGCARETARDAVRFSHLVRQRFTLGDVLAALGRLTDENIDAWMSPSTS
jgi:glycerol-1-phosphate dehydrogenase [NAD(P)+]